jgi:hypothetical protein
MVSATTFTKEYGHAVSLLIMVYFYSVAREGARAVGEVFDDGEISSCSRARCFSKWWHSSAGVFMITCTSVLSVSKA